MNIFEITRREFLESFGLMSAAIALPEALALWSGQHPNRLAMIGINDTSIQFLRILGKLPAIEVVGLVDSDLSAVRRATAVLGTDIIGERSVSDLLRSTRPDAIIVSSAQHARSTSRLWNGRSLFLDPWSLGDLETASSSRHFHALPAAWPMHTWLALRDVVLAAREEFLSTHIEWTGPVLDAPHFQRLLAMCLSICGVAVPALDHMSAATLLGRSFTREGEKISSADISFRIPASGASVRVSYKPSIRPWAEDASTTLPRGQGRIDFETSRNHWDVPIEFGYDDRVIEVVVREFIDSSTAPGIYSCKRLNELSRWVIDVFGMSTLAA